MLISSGIIVRRGIYQTESVLWEQMPAIASISFDFQIAQQSTAEGDASVWETALNPAEIQEK